MIEDIVSRLPGLGALKRDATLYATVNGAHILGIALLIGSIVNADLRLAGLWRGATWREALRDMLPLARVGFLLAAATGYLLFMNRPVHYLSNPAFQAKAAFLGLALANVLLFHALPKTGGARPGAAMRASALASLLLWTGMLFAGRWIAFV